MKKKAKNVEDLIREKLAQQGVEVVSLDQKGEKEFQVQGNMLHPVDIDNNKLYVQVPVNANVLVNKASGIENVDIEKSSEQTRDAEQFVKTLVANKQLYGFNDQFPAGATHSVEKNEKNQWVVKRKRFSAY